MTALTEQESKWVDDLAGRLRLIQAGAAETGAEKRREYLQEEVTRQLGKAPAGQRKRYLSALAARFPVCGRVSGPGQPAPAPERPAPKPIEETAEQILERLLLAAPGVSEERRAIIARRLGENGLAWVDKNALTLAISEDFRKKLALPDDQQVRLTRLVELGTLLIDALYSLDKRALATLNSLSPKSKALQRHTSFRAAAARFLTSEDEPLDPNLRALNALLGALMAALLAVGKDFERQHWNQFSPEAIEGVVAMEGGGKFWPKANYWDKYVELANRSSAREVMERQIKDCLARIVDKILESQ